MKRTIADFLVELAKNPKKLAQFDADPDASMTNAGLTKRQRDVIRRGDALEIKHVVDYESGHGGLMIVCTHHAPPP